MEQDSCFYDIVTDPLRFPKQLSISFYLLPVSRGQFGSNVRVTGFAVKHRYKLYRCDIFEC